MIFGTELFDGKIGHLPIVAWVNKKEKTHSNKIHAIKLSQFNYSLKNKKKEEFYNKENYYSISQKLLFNIPGNPLAYSISDKMIKNFKDNKSLSKISKPLQGLATADNARFVRNWFEVDYNKIYLNAKSLKEAEISRKKWFPYNKGGDIRKWYGNDESVVNWENNGYEIKNFKDKSGKLRSRPQNLEYYFKKSITWSLISNDITFRAKNIGQIFDVAGMSFFPQEDIYLYMLGLCNSKVVSSIMKIIAPTLNYQIGDVEKIPIKIDKLNKDEIEDIVKNNIELSKEDWDSFETSWNFKINPIIKWKVPEANYIGSKPEYTIEMAFKEYKDNANAEFEILKNNEEKLNRKFIEIYDLKEELTYEESDRDVTIHKIYDTKQEIPEELKKSQYVITKQDIIKSLISYAVGCMFGRYSLDKDGLIYAGGELDESQYKTFPIDKDNIIPITDESYFGDDIVSRFKKFIEVAFGKETLTENLNYIAESLGKKEMETDEDTIRRYFLNDFYNDHVKIYKKRPIYLLFDSGKKNGFKALIYMHRYNEDTIAKLRVDYLHRIQETYRQQLTDIDYKLTTELSVQEKKEILRKQSDLNAKLTELKPYEEKIEHLANQRISIDLDDGVKVNYEKFKDVLAKIK